MSHRRRFVCFELVVCSAVLGLGASPGRGGDLNPPPGPVGPTGRFGPRTEISDTKTPGDADSLFKITQPGSYYLTGNITGVSGKHGIEIAANDVTLDLNGFALIGIPGSIDGVSFAPGVENPVVRQGTIRAWGSFGIGAQDNLNRAIYGLYEDLRVSANGLQGLRVGPGSRVLNCGSNNNGDDGFNFLGPGSSVVDCNAAGNGGNGFITYESTVFTNCTAVDNGPSSYADGFDVRSGSILTGCAARGNGGNGIRVDPTNAEAATVTGCTAVSNTGYGINAPNSLIHGNAVANNTAGGCNAPGSTCVENHGCSCP